MHNTHARIRSRSPHTPRITAAASHAQSGAVPCRGHTAPLRTPPPRTRIQAWPRTFRCGPALSKTYLGYRRTVSALQVIVRRWLSGLDVVSVATRCLLEAYGCWHACCSDSEANRGCNLRKY